MKILFGTLAMTMMTAAPAFATSQVVARCTDGDQTKVVVRQITPTLYQADVTMESTGGSYPTFHFKNVEKQPTPALRLGAPAIYSGNGFEITIQYDAANAPATLNVPSIGIDDLKMNCR